MPMMVDLALTLNIMSQYNFKIHYKHVPIVGKYNNIPSHEDAKLAAVETQLELGMFKEAQELIARIKNA